MLCLAADSYDEYDGGMLGMSLQELCDTPPRLFRAACMAMECGDWMGPARLRTIQAICLVNSHLLWESSPGSTERFERYSVCAVRVCQALELHTIPDDPSQLPELDATTKLLSQPLQRELALRLLYVTVTMDQMCHRHRAALSIEDGE